VAALAIATTFRFRLTPAVFRAMKPTSGLALYVTVFASIGPAYLITLLMTGHAMLSVSMATITALVVAVVLRLWQRRGKITLSTVVIIVPLLMSLLFSGIGLITPLAERQRTIDLLRSGGVQFYANGPSRQGEWYGIRDGWVLPTWLVDSIGHDSLSEVHTLSSELGEFQSLSLDQIHLVKRPKIELSRVSQREPPISPQLVAWLNQLDSPRIHLKVEEFSKADSDTLANLDHGFSLTITNIDRSSGDLSKLSRASQLTVHGSRLSEMQAEQLAAIVATTTLELSGLELTPPAIDTLFGQSPSNHSRIGINDCSLNDAMVGSLVARQTGPMNFRRVALPGIKTLIDWLGYTGLSHDAGAPVTGAATTAKLYVEAKQLTIDEACQLVALFPCHTIVIALAAAPLELDRLWTCSDLRQVDLVEPGTGRIISHHRPPADR
jgi:hypothetical protein